MDKLERAIKTGLITEDMKEAWKLKDQAKERGITLKIERLHDGKFLVSPSI